MKKITIVYLRSGRTMFVAGSEISRQEDVLFVYPEEGGREVTFNWDHVESYRVSEYDADVYEAALKSIEESPEHTPPQMLGTYF